MISVIAGMLGYLLFVVCLGCAFAIPYRNWMRPAKRHYSRKACAFAEPMNGENE